MLTKKITDHFDVWNVMSEVLSLIFGFLKVKVKEHWRITGLIGLAVFYGE